MLKSYYIYIANDCKIFNSIGATAILSSSWLGLSRKLWRNWFCFCNGSLKWIGYVPNEHVWWDAESKTKSKVVISSDIYFSWWYCSFKLDGTDKFGDFTWSSWWLNHPFEKKIKLDHFPRVNFQKHIWNHHLPISILRLSPRSLEVWKRQQVPNFFPPVATDRRGMSWEPYLSHQKNSYPQL